MQQDHSQQMYDASRIHKFLGWDFEIATSGSRAFWQISDGGRSYVAAIESLSFDGPRMTIPERPIPVDLTPAWPGAAPPKPQPSILTLSHLPPAAHKPSHHIKFHISSSNSQDRMTFACTTFTGFEQIYSCSWLQPIKVAVHESCSSPPSLHRKSWEQEAGGGCSLWCCSGHRAQPPPPLLAGQREWTTLPFSQTPCVLGICACSRHISSQRHVHIWAPKACMPERLLNILLHSSLSCSKWNHISAFTFPLLGDLKTPRTR